ncbi:MAG: hypothetical protein NVSMB3_04400 [Acidobacteriaceae bacterium]
MENQALEIYVVYYLERPQVWLRPDGSEQHHADRSNSCEQHRADGVRQLQNAGTDPSEQSRCTYESADDL